MQLNSNFAVHIGGGMYLDADGNLRAGAPSETQIYQPPGGLRLDTKKLQDALKDLAGLLPQNDADKAKWMKWGVPKGVVDFLAKVAGVAAPLATALAIYTWAIGVLLTLMDALTGDEGLSPEFAKALYSIKNQLQGMEQIDRADKMIALHAQFDGRTDLMHGKLLRLVTEKPVGAVRAAIFGEMRAIVDELAVPLSTLRNQEWAVTYDSDAYKGQAFASQLLTYERSDGTQAPVPMSEPDVTSFDYRLGVPMLIYGATTFTALVQVAMPWFRSAGTYAHQLRRTAEAIDRFVIRMQDECLARTHYTDQIFFDQQTWSIFEIPGGGGPREWMGMPLHSCAVGAFDLVRYNDKFLTERYVAQQAAGQDTGPRGLFNYHWQPPVTFAFVQLSELADAANEQSQLDYANLQVSSGLLRLVHTAAWLRHLSTPPQVSQTVSGRTSDTRIFRCEAPTKATSPQIPFTGVIESDAKLRRYDASSRTLVATQEPGYVPAFRYRVVLRTLDTLFGQEGWRALNYVGDVWQADYEPAMGDSRCKRLRTRIDSGRVLQEVVLFEGTSSNTVVQRSGHVSVRAATFDWYVPVVPPRREFVSFADERLMTSGVKVWPNLLFDS